MTTKTNFVMFFALATILLASPFATGNAYADNVDKAEAKGLKEWEKAEKKISKEQKKVDKAEAKFVQSN
jgi:hypothetical protein